MPRRDAVTTPLAEFERDFDTVWRVVNPYGRCFVQEEFGFSARRLSDTRKTVYPIGLRDDACRDLAAARDLARRETKANLLKNKRDWIEILRRADRRLELRGKPGILAAIERGLTHSYTNAEHDRRNAKEQIRHYQESLDRLDAEGPINAVRLPDPIHHYGRLTPGTRVWGVADKDAAPRLVTFLVTEEKAPDISSYRSNQEDRKNPFRIEGAIRRLSEPAQPQGAGMLVSPPTPLTGPEILVELGPNGLQPLTEVSMTLFFDHAEAVAARDALTMAPTG